MEEKKDITFRVYRFNPQADAHSFYDTFRISVEQGITVLRALNYIKDNVEPTLSYRFFCQAGICGSCAMRINGVSKLACTTQVWDELENCKTKEVITIEPLNNLNILRDIVVDMDPVVEKMNRYSTWVHSKMPEEKMGEKEFIVAEEEFLVYDRATDCILCASCLSECTITNGSGGAYISPLILLRSFRMNADSRDAIGNQRLATLVKDHGAWDCTHCYRCQEACVKNIPIMDAIHHIREQAIAERGPRDTEGARHAALFVDDIKSKGRLVESMLPVKTLGPFKFLFTQLPLGMRMMLKGRVPPPPFLMKAIPGIKSVRRMLKEFSAYQKENKKSRS